MHIHGGYSISLQHARRASQLQLTFSTILKIRPITLQEKPPYLIERSKVSKI